MTIVMGMHMGHDASVAIVRDGHLVAFAQRERLSRIKHAYGLDRATLNHVLDQAGICSAQEIDWVAVTSTQGSDIPFCHLSGVELNYTIKSPPPLGQRYPNWLNRSSEEILTLCSPSMFQRVLGHPRDLSTSNKFLHFFAEYRDLSLDALRRFPWLDRHGTHPLWERTKALVDWGELDIRSLMSDSVPASAFQYPVILTMDGHNIPGIRLDHHLGHAASSYYRSGLNNALVVTVDGYGGLRTPFAAGGVYWGAGNHLFPLMPHGLMHGDWFDAVGEHVGLDAIGASGKLMGLAPYGAPDYFDKRFVGNRADLKIHKLEGTVDTWLEHCRRQGHLSNDIGADSGHFGLPFDRYQVNVAASTQALFEACWLLAIQAGQVLLKNAGVQPSGLCLSGGAALNCPCNSRIAREGGLNPMFIEPNCDDSGQSIGAALWLARSGLEDYFGRGEPMSVQGVFTGPSKNLEIDELRSMLPPGVTLEALSLDTATQNAARDLEAGRIVGWFQGGSEMGPRALGHRSLLAAPFDRTMHYRVNALKNREQWRPLAPVVLAPKLEKFFDPPPAERLLPFMLATATVRDQRLTAITHVDGSSRVQAVTPDHGSLFHILKAFEALTGVPVLINTSMNGPGEPIVERPEEALQFFLRSGLEALYLDGVRIGRKEKNG